MEKVRKLEHRAAILVDRAQGRLGTVLLGRDRTSMIAKLAYIRGAWRDKSEDELIVAIESVEVENAIADGTAWLGKNQSMSMAMVAILVGIPDVEKLRRRHTIAVFAAACRAILSLEEDGRN